MSLASSKLYGNDELHLPKIIKEEFTDFKIDENTIFEWDIKDNEIILTPRKKITLEDVAGIIKKEKDTPGKWEINKGVYLNE